MRLGLEFYNSLASLSVSGEEDAYGSEELFLADGLVSSGTR